MNEPEQPPNSPDEKQTILERAMEACRRQSFLEALNADFAALRAQPKEWAEEMEERKLWEQTLADGWEQA